MAKQKQFVMLKLRVKKPDDQKTTELSHGLKSTRSSRVILKMGDNDHSPTCISPLLPSQKTEKSLSLISLRTSRLNSESQTTD